MTLEELEAALAADARCPEDAVRAFVSAGEGVETLAEALEGLPPKARFVGPGPWIEAVAGRR